MDTVKELNKILVSLFNSVLKMEEEALKGSTNHNLSVTEIHTLVAIGEGKPKTMTHIAAKLKISVSTLTAAINKLLAKGYVNRFRIPEDRRIVKIELTESGVQAVREHESFHTAMIRDALAHLSQEKAEEFVQSLANVNEFMLMRRSKPMMKTEKIKILPSMIYQGGMGIGISLGNLAAAVAICGGTGIISASQPGFMEKDFYSNAFEANKRALQRHIREALAKVKKAAGKGLIGINIMCAANHYEEYVKAAIEAGAQVIVSGAGLPTALPGICKGSNVKLIPIVSSARAAAIIIKNWTKKHNRTPDAIIFEGPMAGGHLGYKEEQLETAQDDFYKEIVDIKTELEGLPECSLIVGGGIHTKADADKVLACGADAIQLGSRFVTTEECDAPDEFKQAYISCTENDIVIMKSPAGMPGRALNNHFLKRTMKESIPIKECNNCLISCDNKVAPYCLTNALITSAKGDVENGLVFCGGKAYKSDKIETVKQVFDEFTKED